MTTDYFSLRLSTLTTDLNIAPDVLESTAAVGRQALEDQRRAGVPVDLATERAEAIMLETITPVIEAASRLKDILEDNFAGRPELSVPPHFPVLLQKFMLLLVEPRSRLTDAYIIGVVVEYTDKPIGNGL